MFAFLVSRTAHKFRSFLNYAERLKKVKFLCRPKKANFGVLQSDGTEK